LRGFWTDLSTPNPYNVRICPPNPYNVRTVAGRRSPVAVLFVDQVELDPVHNPAYAV